MSIPSANVSVLPVEDSSYYYACSGPNCGYQHEKSEARELTQEARKIAKEYLNPTELFLLEGDLRTLEHLAPYRREIPPIPGEEVINPWDSFNIKREFPNNKHLLVENFPNLLWEKGGTKPFFTILDPEGIKTNRTFVNYRWRILPLETALEKRADFRNLFPEHPKDLPEERTLKTIASRLYLTSLSALSRTIGGPFVPVSDSLSAPGTDAAPEASISAVRIPSPLIPPGKGKKEKAE